MSSSATRTATVHNGRGLHLRPAGLLAQLAAQYRAEVTLSKDGLTVDARSMLDMLTLVATQGSQIVIAAHGEDAEAAVAAIAEFIETDSSDDQEG